MVWLIEDEAIVKEIDGQRDRPAAITSVAYLEHRLGETLRAVMEPHQVIANQIFKGYGPLASFSAKIDMAFMIGLYPEYIHRSLRTVKDIRNEFAHNPKPVTFKSQRIADLCKNLPKPLEQKKFKLTYSDALLILAAKTEDPKWRGKALTLATSTGKDTPRIRFLNCVKQILLHLLLMQQIAEQKRYISEHQPGHFYWPWPSLDKPLQRLPRVPVSGRRTPKEP